MKTDKKIKLLCISRKYYPSIGGIQNFCASVFSRIDKDDFDVTLLVLGRSQLHLLWFLPYVCLYLIFHAKQYDAVFVGDLLMCITGVVCKKFSPQTKRLVAVHGLDITYDNRLYQWYLRRYAKNSFDLYACNSEATSRLLADRNIDRSIIIPSGVDKARYRGLQRNQKIFLQRLGQQEKKTIILTAGRLIRRKGVKWFVENVVPYLSDDILYLIVGNGPEREAIIQSIRDGHLSEKIIMITDASDEVLNDCYINADVFVMPNIKVENDMEGFGLVAVEASLAGNMVIASNIDGISTAVIEGKNGYLVESQNRQAFLDKIDQVLQEQNDSEARKRTAEFTAEHFDWSIVTKRYEDAVKGLIGKSGNTV